MSKNSEIVERVLNRIKEYNEEINTLNLESKKIEKELGNLKDELKDQGFIINDFLFITSDDYGFVNSKIATSLKNKSLIKAVKLCNKNTKIVDESIQRNHCKNDFIKSVISKFELTVSEAKEKEQTPTRISFIKNVSLFINKLQSLQS